MKTIKTLALLAATMLVSSAASDVSSSAAPSREMQDFVLRLRVPRGGSMMEG